MIREKKRGKEIRRIGLKRNFQLVILPGWFRGALRVQGCSPGTGVHFSHDIETFHEVDFRFFKKI